MTQIHWLKSVNGNFTNMADWSGGVAPGASDDAILDASGAAFTVTASAAVTVNGIQTSTNATLDITDAGIFTASAGTDGGASAGTIIVEASAVLTVAGTVKNSGSIMFDGASDFDATNVTFAGGGVVLLHGGTGQGAVDFSGAGALTNADNTILATGDANIGAGLTFYNDAGAVVDTTGELNLTTANSTTITNAGLIETTGVGAMTIGTPILNWNARSGWDRVYS